MRWNELDGWDKYRPEQDGGRRAFRGANSCSRAELQPLGLLSCRGTCWAGRDLLRRAGRQAADRGGRAAHATLFSDQRVRKAPAGNRLFPAQVPPRGRRGRHGIYHRATARPGRTGICCSQRENHPGLHRLWHPGAPGNAGHARHAGDSDCGRVRSCQRKPRICGLVEGRTARGNCQRDRQAGLATRCAGHLRWPGGRQGSHRDLLWESTTFGKVQGLAVRPTRIFASCWKRKRTWTPSRS